MKYQIMSLVLGLAFMGLSNQASADREDKRQVRQRARIHEGVRSGELTHDEAKKLRAGERRIRRMERRAEADGIVTEKEAAKLERAQDRMSDKIHQEKHDDQKRDQAPVVETPQ